MLASFCLHRCAVFPQAGPGNQVRSLLPLHYHHHRPEGHAFSKEDKDTNGQFRRAEGKQSPERVSAWRRTDTYAFGKTKVNNRLRSPCRGAVASTEETTETGDSKIQDGKPRVHGFQ